jgi:hypothetical protein
MSTPDSFDRESFQSLLANAFSVQQSGMSPESLAAIIEIQRIVSKDDINADSAMNLIAERATKVAGASGIAIALLAGNQLVHCAGVGSASKLLGSQLAAVLATAGQNHPRREILRVEDARTDSRIEADICRQFEAQALLMVPIYRDGAMMGVFEVLFNQPHNFREPEVRTYQLMATLAGDASALPLQHSKQELARPSSVPHALWRIISETQHHQIPRAHVPQPVQQYWYDSMYAKMSAAVRHATSTARVPELVKETIARLQSLSLPNLRWPRVSLPTFEYPRIPLRTLRWRSAFHSTWSSRAVLSEFRWQLAAVALLIVGAVAAPIVRHRSTSSAVNSSGQIPSPAASQISSPDPLPVSTTAKPQPGTLPRDAQAPNRAFRRVRVGKNEVDYVADDVTIRRFQTGSATIETRPSKKEVKIGEDVTVRYFNGQHLPQAQPASATEQSVRE